MFYILSAIFLWSSLGIVIRFSGMPVPLLIFFSNLLSSLILSLLFLRREYRKKIPGGKSILYLLSIGPISLVNTFSFFHAYRSTSIANAVLTHYTAPVIVASLAPFFLKEKLTSRILAAVTIATAGLWIMLGVSATQFMDLLLAGDVNTGGILSGLFSGFSYALLIILLRRISPQFDPLVMTFFQNIVISTLLLPFIKIPGNVLSGTWAFIVMGIVHSTIAPALYFKGMERVTANRAAILGYLEPVCAILLGVLFLGEAVGYRVVIGGLMILLSGYITLSNNR